MWDCRCLHFWHKCCLLESCVLLINNNELARWTIHGTIVPYWKNAVGLGSFVCHTKSKKKGWKSGPSCWWRTLHQQEEAIKHNDCKRWLEQWSKSKKTDGKADRAVDDEPYINERKPSSTTAAKGDLNNGPSPKKMDGNGNQVINDEPIHQREEAIEHDGCKR